MLAVGFRAPTWPARLFRGSGDQGGLDGDPAPSPQNLDFHGIPRRAVPDGRHEAGLAGDGLPIDGQDDVVDLDPGNVGRTVLFDLGDDRALAPIGTAFKTDPEVALLASRPARLLPQLLDDPQNLLDTDRKAHVVGRRV